MHETKNNLPERKIPAVLQTGLPEVDEEAAEKNTARISDNFDPAKVKAPIPISFPTHRAKLKLHGEGRRQPVHANLKESGILPHFSKGLPGFGLRRQELDGFSLYKVFKRNSLTSMFMLLENCQDAETFIETIRRYIDDFLLMPCEYGEWFSPIGRYLEGLSIFQSSTHQAKTLHDEVERRREAEDQLCESQKSFRLALDASFNGVWDLNLLTGEINFGENWYRNLGYEKGSQLSAAQPWQTLIHPDDLQRILAMHSSLAQGINPHCEIEYRIKNSAGEWRWILSRGHILTRDEKGKVLHIMGIDTDITRLKQIESELKSAKVELERQVLDKAAELHTTHIALDVLLRKRETDKAALESCIMDNIDTLVEPFLTRLEQSQLNDQQKILLEILRNTIKELTSPFADTFSARLTHLTPSEIPIANLVKMGKRPKEIT